MNTTAIMIFVATALLVAIAFTFRYFKKPKTDLEKAQANLDKAEKMIKKQKDALDKSGQKFEAFKNDLIRKNDEMLKEIQRNQGQ